MKIKVWLTAAAVFISALGPARAADVKLSGVVFGQYAHQLSNNNYKGDEGKDRGAFGISRIYMTGEAKYSPELKAKVVLEGSSREIYVTSGTSNAVFVKNAFGEYVFNDRLSAAFGMIPTPWIDFEKEVWGRRFVQKTNLAQAGVLNSADLGAGLVGKLPRGYGEYHAVYVNGEGYNKDEKSKKDGRRKDVMLRVSLVPFSNSPHSGIGDLSGLKFHGYIQQGRVSDGARQLRDRYIAGVSYQKGKCHFMYYYLRGHDGDGTANRITNSWSAHGSYRLLRDFSLFGRYDSFRKAAAAGPEAYDRGTIGVDHKLADGARISLSDQWLQVVKSVSGSNKSNENQLMAQFELKF
ncbi:MAG: hypothetical protein HY796_03650 [Elusimicrobia bacterium]|nr:hypothetical protein [Elusimicrobiota bacterium]